MGKATFGQWKRTGNLILDGTTGVVTQLVTKADPEQLELNARAIIAVPEMIEVLKEYEALLEMAEHYSSMSDGRSWLYDEEGLKRIRALLAKVDPCKDERPTP